MRKIVSLIVMLCIIISLTIVPASAAETAVLTAAPAPDHILLTWSGDPATTQTITWRTDTSVTTGTVKYAVSPADPAGGKQAEAAVKELETELGKQNLFTAAVTGLTPNTTYTYIVGSGTNWSAAGTFTTAPADTDSFKFLIYTDSQANTMDGATVYTQWQETFPLAYQRNPEAKFVLGLGDNVDIGSSGYEWDLWFEGAKGIVDKIPLMCVVGNHETVEKGVYSLPFTHRALFEYPQAGVPDSLKDQTYSFNYGNIHFIALDTQAIEEAIAGQTDVDKLQTEWLISDLEANAAAGNTDWTIIFMHKPFYCTRGVKSNDALKQAYLPIFDKYHVDVVLDAHDHAYSRTYPMFGDSPVSSTNEGTVYIQAGRIGVKAFPESYGRLWDAFFYDPQDQANYMTAEVSGTTLNFKCFKTDGTLIDDYTIDKVTGTDSPKTCVPGRNDKPRMAIYGQYVQLPTLACDPKVTADGVWYVPVRSFVQFLGGPVTWNGTEGTATLVYGKTTAVIKPGSTAATVNGKPVPLLHPLDKAKNGATLIAADDLKTLFNFKNKIDTSLNAVLFYT
jgi:hypothetical protein